MDREQLAFQTYFDQTFALDAVKLLPGEYYVTTSNMVLVTVLGSCVSACIWDQSNGIGGMNHFMLPENNHAGKSCIDKSARYGAYAMELLINNIIQSGGKRENLAAKVFGGGRMLSHFHGLDVGLSNAEFVIRYFKNESIPVCAEDLLGDYPRKVYFFPKTGKVMVRKLKKVSNNTIEMREKSYFSKVNQSDAEGDYDLFS
ncbi:chemoreceptor glutamine deamidase CheD [Psychromonas ossibalaenae]|uniref:chemoreceptor glutamine deamidase CheD n=1 Tax=Psychromonas ossibalaenae TaxID=444922 RepID=UPI00036B8EF0|nr:chemoreceptor glutamine deamidase CheD [Psychromonas ossibalaenae]